MVSASTLAVVSHLSATQVTDGGGAPSHWHVTVPVGKLFIGLQVTGNGPYTVYASGGGDNNIKLFTISAAGVITQNGQNGVPSGASFTFVPQTIAIAPITPKNAGYVSNYALNSTLNAAVQAKQDDVPDQGGNTGPCNFAPPLPGGGNGSQITFPAGSALHGRFLYVACNGDNSLAVIDTPPTPSSAASPSATSPTASASAATAARCWSPTGASSSTSSWAPPTTATAI